MPRRPPCSTLFPYTTLFRSGPRRRHGERSLPPISSAVTAPPSSSSRAWSDDGKIPTAICRCRSISRAEEPSRLPDLAGIEWRRDEQDQPMDAGALERLPRLRVRPEPALLHPREHRHDEPGRVAPRRRVFVARAPHELAELRMERLRVEPVPVPAGDGGHAGTEAAHDDRRWRLGPEESRLARPEPPDHLDRFDDAPGARLVALDRLPQHGLLDGGRSAAGAGGAEPEEQSTARDRLKRRRH